MAHAPSDILSHRHHTIRSLFRASAIDALVVTALPNVLYLTNFTGSAAMLVVTGGRMVFVTDHRYTSALAAARGTSFECPGLEVVAAEGSHDAALASVLESLDARRIGFEAAHLSVGRHAWLETALRARTTSVELAPTQGLIERARAVKDAHEVAVLTEAARRLSAVGTSLLSRAIRGLSERDVALEIDWALRRAGFERSAFETIVASGPNAALPHARPTGRKLTEGDLVVLDFGGVYDSYCVDLTRTVSIGPASSRAKAVHAAVLRAQDAAIAAVAPGVSRFEVDAAARRVLGDAGMGEAFAHGTGHGLGLEVHEDPRIVRRRADVDDRDEALLPGMAFTVEPGAYFPGWGGVRIEDDVIVTGAGADRLTDVPTDLREL
jgi:Xaa-Pro aminopeptidase